MKIIDKTPLVNENGELSVPQRVQRPSASGVTTSDLLWRMMYAVRPAIGRLAGVERGPLAMPLTR